jgi:hypothetical protein
VQSIGDREGGAAISVGVVGVKESEYIREIRDVTSVPACRNAPRNETKRRYFKFKRLRICELLKTSIHFHFSALYASPEHS